MFRRLGAGKPLGLGSGRAGDQCLGRSVINPPTEQRGQAQIFKCFLLLFQFAVRVREGISNSLREGG
jgi:hypothetical protein